jgi:hypothetical protein
VAPVSERRHEVRVPPGDRARWAAARPCRAHGHTRPCAEPSWSAGCDVCGARPVVCETGLCGPCTFGEAATAGGNW